MEVDVEFNYHKNDLILIIDNINLSIMEKQSCSICMLTYDEMGHAFDGPSNSDIDTDCIHYFCTLCLHKMFDNKYENDIKCPLCRRDISDWWESHHYEEGMCGCGVWLED